MVSQQFLQGWGCRKALSNLAKTLKKCYLRTPGYFTKSSKGYVVTYRHIFNPRLTKKFLRYCLRWTKLGTQMHSGTVSNMAGSNFEKNKILIFYGDFSEKNFLHILKFFCNKWDHVGGVSSARDLVFALTFFLTFFHKFFTLGI